MDKKAEFRFAYTKTGNTNIGNASNTINLNRRNEVI